MSRINAPSVRSKRTLLLLSGLVVVIAAGVTLVLVVGRGPTTPPDPAGAASAIPASASESVSGPSTETAAGSPSVPFDKARADQLSTDLASGDIATISRSVVMPENASIETDAAAAFQALGPVTFDPGSFQDLGDSTASVTATTASASWTVYLTLVGGQWLIAATGDAP